MKNMILVLLLFLFLLLTSSSQADRRYFGRSYMANTLPAKAFEFELWNTARIGKAEGYYYRFQPRMEFEYGITDRLTTSFYMNFNSQQIENPTTSSKEFAFAGTAVEFRYRLTELGEYMVDPAVYFELTYAGSEIEYESKLILSKRIGSIITALNITGEIGRDVIANKHETSFELTGGLGYDITPTFAASLEFKNHSNFNNIYGRKANSALFIGPSINLLTDKFYFTVNFLAQVTGEPAVKSGLDLTGHEKYEIRTILGIEL
ncbi:MAG: hypothetical protein M0P61_03750 [Ignavibacteriaceae bacterium]|jgi:hypothetical protein|nr:hypothetical protein [Ignavibacteriaceae bacterium]